MESQEPQLEHQWKLMEGPELTTRFPMCVRVEQCSLCQCKKYVIKTRTSERFQYWRGLRHFGNEAPECIDWDSLKEDRIDP